MLISRMPWHSLPWQLVSILLVLPFHIPWQRLTPSTPWFDSPVTCDLTVVLTRGYVILTYTFTRMHLYLLKYLQICFLCPTLSAKNIKVITFLKNISHRFFFFLLISFSICVDASWTGLFPLSAHTFAHGSALSTVPLTVQGGSDLCIYRDSEQWKTLIRCHVLHRSWSRLKEDFKHVLQHRRWCVCVCVSVPVPKGPVASPE